MVIIESIILSRFKKVRENRFIKPIIDVAKQIDPDRTLKKLQRRR